MRQRTHAGEAFYRLVLEPMGVTVGMLKGDEYVTDDACKAMAELSNTTVESWLRMNREAKNEQHMP